MRGRAPAVVFLLLAAGGFVWWLLPSDPRAVRTVVPPPPPTRAELLRDWMVRIEQQLDRGELWRQKVYADATRSGGYERPAAAYQRGSTPAIQQALATLRAQPSRANEQDAAKFFKVLAEKLHVAVEASENMRLVRGEASRGPLPVTELERLLREFAEFLEPEPAPGATRR